MLLAALLAQAADSAPGSGAPVEPQGVPLWAYVAAGVSALSLVLVVWMRLSARKGRMLDDAAIAVLSVQHRAFQQWGDGAEPPANRSKKRKPAKGGDRADGAGDGASDDDAARDGGDDPDGVPEHITREGVRIAYRIDRKGGRIRHALEASSAGAGPARVRDGLMLGVALLMMVFKRAGLEDAKEIKLVIETDDPALQRMEYHLTPAQHESMRAALKPRRQTVG